MCAPPERSKAAAWRLIRRRRTFTGIEMNHDAFTHNPFGRIVKLGVT